jgi:hypothetical protein
MEKPYFIFSYWIFTWYLLYFFNITDYNPKFAIIISIIENICILLLMIYYNTKLKIIILFTIMIIILKIIPIYTIWDKKIIWKKDIKSTIILFIIYLFFLIINKKSINDFIKNTKNLILHNKSTLPGMIIIEKINNYFFNKS